jgi:hypothetical protein
MLLQTAQSWKACVQSVLIICSHEPSAHGLLNFTFLSHGWSTVLNYRWLPGPHSLQNSLTDPPVWKVTSCNVVVWNQDVLLFSCYMTQRFEVTQKRWLTDTVKILGQSIYNFLLGLFKHTLHMFVQQSLYLLFCTMVFHYAVLTENMISSIMYTFIIIWTTYMSWLPIYFGITVTL